MAHDCYLPWMLILCILLSPMQMAYRRCATSLRDTLQEILLLTAVFAWPNWYWHWTILILMLIIIRSLVVSVWGLGWDRTMHAYLWDIWRWLFLFISRCHSWNLHALHWRLRWYYGHFWNWIGILRSGIWQTSSIHSIHVWNQWGSLDVFGCWYYNQWWCFVYIHLLQANRQARISSVRFSPSQKVHPFSQFLRLRRICSSDANIDSES